MAVVRPDLLAAVVAHSYTRLARTHRFGPEFLQGLASLKPSELTLRNLVTRGVLSSVAWYIVAALIFIVMPVLTSSPNKKVFVSEGPESRLACQFQTRQRDAVCGSNGVLHAGISL